VTLTMAATLGKGGCLFGYKHKFKNAED